MHYTTSCNTQSTALEDGRDSRPKHVELIGIINKLLLLHLVGYLYYLIETLVSIPCVEFYILLTDNLESAEKLSFSR